MDSLPLFNEYYNSWAEFDAAVSSAIEKHHPLRKRSSLTFEVYNRTVSKGRHDRKNIAEFLSKTFKCTHGIKFRSRGNGKRLRHKLRDIGCPFHVYATAVEFGDSYRVKVRTHDTHNHPIGPDAIKEVVSIQEQDYDLVGDHDHPSPDHILDAGVHENEAILDGALVSTIKEITASAAVNEENTPPVVGVTHSIGPLGAFRSPNVTSDELRPRKFEESTTLESLRQSIAQFAAERDWDQFHTPRNLVLALTGEVGEVCELFQWRGDNKTSVDDWSQEDKVHLGEELSDVMIYLIRLADKCNIDLPTAIHDKMIKNARKYPAELVRGSSKKYNEYKHKQQANV